MVNMLYTMIRNFRNDEEGQGLVEYGLIIALVSILAIGALTTLSGGVNGTFESIAGTLGGGA